MNIESLGELITKEIRLNRAIRTKFDSLFMKNQQKIVGLETGDAGLRKGNFLQELFQEFEEIKGKRDKGEKVAVGQVMALVREVEVEKKYLMDYYYRVKAQCCLNLFALRFVEREMKEKEGLRKKSWIRVSWTLGSLVFGAVLSVVIYFGW